jgi:hypothetical protein
MPEPLDQQTPSDRADVSTNAVAPPAAGRTLKITLDDYKLGKVIARGG